MNLPYSTISLDQLERIDSRLREVSGVRWEWRANDVTGTGGREIAEESPADLFKQLHGGKIKPESIAVEGFPAGASQRSDGGNDFEVTGPDGVRYLFHFKVGINFEPGKNNYIDFRQDVGLAIDLAEDVRKIIGEHPRGRRAKLLMRRRGDGSWYHSPVLWGAVVAIATVGLFVVAVIGLTKGSSPKAHASARAATPASSSAIAACEHNNRGQAATTSVRYVHTNRTSLDPAVRRAIQVACSKSAEPKSASLQVVCGFGYTSKPVTYCSAYDTKTEPPAALTADDVTRAYQEVHLQPVDVRPTAEGFSTIIASDRSQAANAYAATDVNNYSAQGSKTATPPICNVLFVHYANGAQDDTHAGQMGKFLEMRCSKSGNLSVNTVAAETSRLTRSGSPNCCLPDFPRPDSLSRAVIVGGGGLPKQVEMGVIHTFVFPDQDSINEYVSWFRENQSAGDGWESSPVLRVCNVVVSPGGGIYTPDDEADASVVRRVAQYLSTRCSVGHGGPAPVQNLSGQTVH